MGWKLRTMSESNLRYDEDECAGKRVLVNGRSKKLVGPS